MSLRGSLSYLWDTTKPLGQGATSVVYPGRAKSTGEEVAVKVFKNGTSNDSSKEYLLLQNLSHENILTVLAKEEEINTKNTITVMYRAESSLLDLIQDPRNTNGLRDEEFLVAMEHITAGIKYLSDKSVVHRDIKPGNILKFSRDDGRPIFKLTDFGAAKQLAHEDEQFTSLSGTEEYLHPDMYERAVLRTPKGRQFSSKVDLWSMGVTFFHVATGQLPFRSYRGRKDRNKMYEITRFKDSGIISGVQKNDGGPVSWSKTLPETSRLSRGLRKLITPVIARLLESDSSKLWSFDECFRTIDSIIKRKAIPVFCPHTYEIHRMYMQREESLKGLKEIIKEETAITDTSQLLLHDGKQLTDLIHKDLPIAKYPKEIKDTNPIFAFSTEIVVDSPEPPLPVFGEFPHFSTNTTEDDYVSAKRYSAIACCIRQDIELYFTNQALTRRAVKMYIQEFTSKLKHVLECYRQCESFMKNDAVLQQLRSVCAWTGISFETIDQPQSKLNSLMLEAMSCLAVIGQEHLENKALQEEWIDNAGCIAESRCVESAEIIAARILKITAQFAEDRNHQNFSSDEMQIHKCDKNLLIESCKKLKSKLFDHCYVGAKQQCDFFHGWFSKAVKERKKLELYNSNVQLIVARHQSYLEQQCEIFNFLMSKTKAQEVFNPACEQVKTDSQGSTFNKATNDSGMKQLESSEDETAYGNLPNFVLGTDEWSDGSDLRFGSGNVQATYDTAKDVSPDTATAEEIDCHLRASSSTKSPTLELSSKQMKDQNLQHQVNNMEEQIAELNVQMLTLKEDVEKVDQKVEIVKTLKLKEQLPRTTQSIGDRGNRYKLAEQLEMIAKDIKSIIEKLITVCKTHDIDESVLRALLDQTPRNQQKNRERPDSY